MVVGHPPKQAFRHLYDHRIVFLERCIFIPRSLQGLLILRNVSPRPCELLQWSICGTWPEAYMLAGNIISGCPGVNSEAFVTKCQNWPQ